MIMSMTCFETFYDRNLNQSRNWNWFLLGQNDTVLIPKHCLKLVLTLGYLCRQFEISQFQNYFWINRIGFDPEPIRHATLQKTEPTWWNPILKNPQLWKINTLPHSILAISRKFQLHTMLQKCRRKTILRVPGIPDCVQTDDQKFAQTTFLNCIESFAQKGKPTNPGWPAFGHAPHQGSVVS
jgi:hypothetical protein